MPSRKKQHIFQISVPIFSIFHNLPDAVFYNVVLHTIFKAEGALKRMQKRKTPPEVVETYYKRRCFLLVLERGRRKRREIRLSVRRQMRAHAHDLVQSLQGVHHVFGDLTGHIKHGIGGVAARLVRLGKIRNRTDLK